jgi:hypothetical protein
MCGKKEMTIFSKIRPPHMHVGEFAFSTICYFINIE